MPERIAHCPHCGEEIKHLEYSSDIAEWGTCDLDGENFDFSDSETQETNYRCPKCDRFLDPFAENFYEEESEPIKPAPPPNTIINNNTERYGLKFLLCPKCLEKIEILNLNEEIECPNCKITINRDNAKIIII